MPRNTTQTLGATNGGRGGLAGYTELCESIAQFKIDSVRWLLPLAASAERPVTQSDAFGLALFVSFGLWWMVAPRSVITFYDWFHRGTPRRPAKPMAVRIVGLFWVALVIGVFVFGARR